MDNEKEKFKPTNTTNNNINNNIKKNTSNMRNENLYKNSFESIQKKHLNNDLPYNIPPVSANKINSQNPNNKNKTATNLEKKALEKGAEVVGNVVAGPVGGEIGKKIANSPIGDKLLKEAKQNRGILSPLPKSPFSFFKNKNKNTEEEETEGTGEVNFDLEKKIISFGAGGFTLLSGCFSFFVIIVIITLILSPLFYINEKLDGLSSFGEKLGNFLTFRGWCTDLECEEKEKKDFYEKIEDVYGSYRREYDVELNVNLITATLTYFDPFVTTSEDEETSLENLKPSNYVEFKKSKKKVDELAKNMITQCCYENGEEYKCAEYPAKNITCPADVINEETGELEKEYTKEWKLDVDRYRSYLENEFVRKFFFDNKKGENIDQAVETAVDEIFSRVAYFEGSEYEKKSVKVYASCPGVTVTSNGVVLGTYKLDDYVAGVVTAESVKGMEMEAYKAHAIAARTYVLSATNNCSTSIEIGDDTQNFTEEVEEYAETAAQSTTNIIMIDNEAPFLSFYDTFCNDEDICDVVEENGKKYTIYTKLPGGETHKVNLSSKYNKYIDKMTGEGMSLLVAYEMAENGSNYQEILTTFYSESSKISNMISITGVDYVSSTDAPLDAEDIKNRSKLYREMGKAFIGGVAVDISIIYNEYASNLGECVWYAKSRALELIYFSNMSDEDKLKAFTAIASTPGNGSEWYNNPSSEIFNKSTDYTRPAPGAIVSWSSSVGAGASHNYGHVAIIESVDYVNQTVVLSEGWNKKGPGKDGSFDEVVNYKKSTKTFEQLKYYGVGYNFNGYVYILSEGE